MAPTSTGQETNTPTPRRPQKHNKANHHDFQDDTPLSMDSIADLAKELDDQSIDFLIRAFA